MSNGKCSTHKNIRIETKSAHSHVPTPFDAKNMDLLDQSSPISEPFEPYIDASTISFVDMKMKEAFGETLKNNSGSPLDGRVEKIWERSALLRGRVYRLPGGAVGREFTSILASEYDLLAEGSQKSEKPSMFGKLILQKDKHIKKSADIRRLVKRRMQMWRNKIL